MLDVLTRAGSFVFIIALGYVLKRIGFFKEEDFTVLSRITIRITLTAAIITSFSGKTIDLSLLSLVALGIGCGLVYIAIGFFGRPKAEKEQRAFDMLNLSGYNIGAFVIPFAQSFLGPMGVFATSLFDTGNAVICLGGSFSLATMVKDGKHFSIRHILRSLLRSVPFVCYVTMLVLNLLNLQLPQGVLTCAGIIGNANAFMAMLMIGVGLKLDADRAHMKSVARLLGIRYGVAAIFAAVFYFLLPFDLEIRQALVILVFSPIGSAVPGFTGEMHGDVGLSSTLNSMTILISIVITVAMLSIML